jgi:gluconolactonase
MGGDSAGMAGTAGDSAGASGSAGTGGGSNLHGGASGAFVCPPNPGTGDPLAGMSSVTTISPPTMTQPSFFAFVEGPVWIASLGKLFFSDNAGSPERIWQLTPGMTPSVFFEGSGSNGLAIDGDDQLIVTDQVGNRITRVDPTASSPSHMLITAAGSKPNDIIVRSDGNIYFTAPNGGGTGFYRVDPTGMRTGPRTEVNAPNGIVLSPDENTLYVGDVGNRSITAFSIGADGSIGASGTPFATTVNATTDGMCVDCAGNVYAGTQNGVEVFSASGMPRGTVMVGEASNCTFGGADRRTLYVTSRNVIKAVTLAIPGLPD